MSSLVCVCVHACVCVCASFMAVVHYNRNNQLKGLPAELAQCGELRDLVLSFNRFSEVPSVVYQLKKLEHIIADGNQVDS